jgi:ribonuclease HI
MDWAVSNGYERIKIYYDYEGLRKWLSGEWAAKSDVAKMYVSVYTNKFADLVQVNFEKVKGHSNNKYNDKADELAKKALSDNFRVPIAGDSWFSINFFKEDKLQAILDSIAEDYPEVLIEKSENPCFILYKLSLDKYRLSVKLFRNDNGTLFTRGAANVLFHMLITYINELFGVNEEYVFADIYRKSIDKEKIDKEMHSICPNYPADYPRSIIRLIRQSIINLNYSMECEDYSQYVFPAFRALEGHMGYLLQKEGHTMTFRSSFEYFFV